MTTAPQTDTEPIAKLVKFLSRHPPFAAIERTELERVATAAVEQSVHAGQTVVTERGAPGDRLYVVLQGSLDLLHKGHIVDILCVGQVFGHPTLLTGLPPEFSVRAREDSILCSIPQEIALTVLQRPEGVAFVAAALRDRLLQAAHAIDAMPNLRVVPVASLLRGEPVFCSPGTSIREAARLMTDEGVTAVLVPLRDGLGIVTDADLRNRVVADGVPSSEPVSMIMSSPVKTVAHDMLAPQASIEMMEAGFKHLPVVDPRGHVLGVLAAENLMNLDAVSPFALRRSLAAAHSEKDLVEAAGQLPGLIVSLFDAGLDASALTRVITLISDAVTQRLLQLAHEVHGPAPVPYAWLALGSGARNELTLASDQDNALAYADGGDPAVDAYFARLTRDVNAGLAASGFRLDDNGVLADDPHWRMARSQWFAVFRDSLAATDWRSVLRASISFDFRQVYGDLSIVPDLAELMHEAPRHPGFLSSLAAMASQVKSPLGFRQRMAGPIDLKKSALLPIVNLARFYSFGLGIDAQGTLQRLIAVQETHRYSDELIQSLRDAFVTVAHLRLREQVTAVREGRRPDNIVDTAELRPLLRVGLHQALRMIAAAQATLP